LPRDSLEEEVGAHELLKWNAELTGAKDKAEEATAQERILAKHSHENPHAMNGVLG